MGGKSGYLEGAMLDHIFGIADYTRPASVFMALFKGDPDDSGVEVSGGGYARVEVVNDGTNWSRTDSTVINLNDIDFGTASADWATLGHEVTHAAMLDDATAGNLLYSGALSVPRIILNGDPIVLVAGQLQITES